MLSAIFDRRVKPLYSMFTLVTGVQDTSAHQNTSVCSKCVNFLMYLIWDVKVPIVISLVRSTTVGIFNCQLF